MSYQKKDPHMDYKCYVLKNDKRPLRGPRPSTEKFLVALGAGQTFGRWCDKSYPELLGEKVGIDVYNISDGGAGPDDNWIKNYFDVINSSEMCIVQVMSGRCQSIPSRGVYDRGSHYVEGGRVLTRKNWKNFFVEGGEEIWSEVYWKRLHERLTAGEYVDRVNEVLDLYVDSYKRLLSRIRVPTILLYIGHRKPLNEDLSDMHSCLGTFPHFITKSTINKLKKLTDCYVEHIHGNVDKSKLKNGHHSDTSYYPSQDIYEKVASKLTPVVINILKTNNNS